MRQKESDLFCPNCRYDNVKFNEKLQVYICSDCLYKWAATIPSDNIGKKTSKPSKIFFSYGHEKEDNFMDDVLCIKSDLEKWGHKVWFDLKHLKAGVDWEQYIEEGLNWCDKVVLVITPYSVRRRNPQDPKSKDGYCLNEITKAMERNKIIIPIMLKWVDEGVPVSICRIQYLDMTDCIPIKQQRIRYQLRFKQLIEAIEYDYFEFEGGHVRLLKHLQPIKFDLEISKHIARFKGRSWLMEKLFDWFYNKPDSRVFWLVGGPGIGKTAISAYLCHKGYNVAAFHLCSNGHDDKANPRRAILSIAYQLSRRLPAYASRLQNLILEEECFKNAKTLFEKLIIEPLMDKDFPLPEHPLLVVIDGIDEATKNHKNEIAEFIWEQWHYTPPWLRLFITSRPESEVVTWISGIKKFNPFKLDVYSDENMQDLREFLCEELIRLGHKPEESVINAILEKSEGIFLYVVVIIDEIEQGHLTLDNLEAFPSGLTGYYKIFFDRQFSNITEYEEKLAPILEVIIAQREPLPFSIICKATGLSSNELRKRFHKLGSLFPIRMEGSGQRAVEVVTPFHRSVCDWLTGNDKDTGLCIAGDYALDITSGYKSLADACLAEYQAGPEKMSLYALKHLPAHLISAQRPIEDILTDFEFLYTKLSTIGVQSLIEDYDLILTEGILFTEEKKKMLQQIQGAIRLSAYCLAKDPNQMAGQLIGRLGSFSESTHMGRLLKHALKWQHGPWLCPKTNSLIQPGGGLLLTLKGHKSCINAICSTPDGKRIVSASDDTTVKVWDIETGNLENTLAGHTSGVRATAITPDSRYVLSGSDDYTIRAWNLKSARLERTLKAGDIERKALAITPNGGKVISGSSNLFYNSNCTLEIWDWKGGEVECALTAGTQESSASAVAITPDGKHIISGSGNRLDITDCTLKVWDIKARNLKYILTGHEDKVNAVTVTPDGKKAVSASDDYTLKIWDLENGNLEKTLVGHNCEVKGIAVTSDCKHAISVSCDKTIRIWNISTGSLKRTLMAHDCEVRAIAVTPDDKRVISGSANGILKVWDLHRCVSDSSSAGHEDRINALVVTPDGKKAVSASSDFTVKIWDLRSGKNEHTFTGHKGSVYALAITPDGNRIISGSSDHTIRFWNLKTKDLNRTLKNEDCEVRKFVVAPDGSRAVSISGNFLDFMEAPDCTIRVWNLENGMIEHTLEGHKKSVYSVAITPDGKAAVSASGDHTIKIWDLESGELIRTITGHEGEIRTVAITPNGMHVISGSDDRTLRVWNLETGLLEYTINGGDADIQAMVMIPDGKHVITTSGEQTLKVWDLENRHVLATFTGEGALSACTIAPDGLNIIAGEGSGRIHFLTLQGVSPLL